MLLADLLRPVLHGCAPHQGILKLLDDALVNSVAEVFHLRNRSQGQCQHSDALITVMGMATGFAAGTEPSCFNNRKDSTLKVPHS